MSWHSYRKGGMSYGTTYPSSPSLPYSIYLTMRNLMSSGFILLKWNIATDFCFKSYWNFFFIQFQRNNYFCIHKWNIIVRFECTEKSKSSLKRINNVFLNRINIFKITVYLLSLKKCLNDLQTVFLCVQN